MATFLIITGIGLTAVSLGTGMRRQSAPGDQKVVGLLTSVQQRNIGHVESFTLLSADRQVKDARSSSPSQTTGLLHHLRGAHTTIIGYADLIGRAPSAGERDQARLARHVARIGDASRRTETLLCALERAAEQALEQAPDAAPPSSPVSSLVSSLVSSPVSRGAEYTCHADRAGDAVHSSSGPSHFTQEEHS